jgi:hypothetical protein
MQKPQAQPKPQCNGSIEQKLPETDSRVAQLQAKIEAGPFQMTDYDESVEARIEQQHLAEDGQVRGPGTLKPAQVDGKAECDKN